MLYSVGTLVFCWNVLEHLRAKIVHARFSVGTLKPLRGSVGTFQQNSKQ
jgi:hypothetical protein